MTNDNDSYSEKLDRLRLLQEACGPTGNQNDVVKVLISACIEEELDTVGLICGALKRRGFSTRHVAKVLLDNAGSSPERHLWRRDEEGRYRLHEGAFG